jgi:hypothetical protein
MAYETDPDVAAFLTGGKSSPVGKIPTTEPTMEQMREVQKKKKVSDANPQIQPQQETDYTSDPDIAAFTSVTPPKATSQTKIPSQLNQVVGKGLQAVEEARSQLKGAAEAGATVLSSAAALPVAALSGLVYGIRGGEAPEQAKRIMQELTYMPKTEKGQQYLEDLQRAFEASKIPPIGLPELAGTQMLRQGATAQVTGAPEQLRASFQKLKSEIPTVRLETKTPAQAGSVGAAAIPEQTLRIQRAQELPIPIDLSKDQITRAPDDVRFARETAKSPTLGQPLQEHYAKQNSLIQKNLDYMVENTGAELTGLNPVELGKKLVDVVEPKRRERKAGVTQAYKLAEGEMAEPINVQQLANYAASHEAEAINAPVIKSLEIKVKNLAKDGEISLHDLEEVRKMVTNLSQDSPTNAHYGKQINTLIDSLTEGKGGEKYKAARKLNAEFMTEFENTPVIKNITALKRGNSTQRAVAMEDLIQKSVVGSTLDDTQRLFNSLSKMGPEGEQMVNELKGAVAQRIKDQATKNVQLDINGKPYVSTPALNTIITDLDKSGKLDFLFGKKGAEHYRTLNQVTKEIQTVPQGTTNTSGTAAQVAAMLAETGAGFLTTGVPAPILTGGKILYSKYKTKQELNKISEFINYGKENK